MKLWACALAAVGVQPVPLCRAVVLRSEAVKQSLLVVEMENRVRASFLLFWGDGETQQRQAFCGNFVLKAHKKRTSIWRAGLYRFEGFI